MLQLSWLTAVLSNIAVNRCVLASIEVGAIANAEHAMRLGLLLLGGVVGGVMGMTWGRVRSTDEIDHDRSLPDRSSDDRQQSDASLQPVLQPALMEMPDHTCIEVDRKQAEVDLHASRAFLNQVFDVISDTIFVKDEQYRFVLVNQAVCDLVGVAQEAFLGRSDYDLFPQAQANHFRQKDHHVFQTGLEDVTEEPLTNQNGEMHWLLTKKACFQNQQGQKFLVGSSRDITDRKQAETMLSDREAVLRDLYRATSDRHLSFQEKLRQLLAVGCHYFQLENGMAAVLDEHICRAIATHSPLPEWVEGLVYDVDQAFCGEALQMEAPFSIQHVSATEWRNHPSYILFGTETYLGAKVQVKNSVHAILCFTSNTPCPRLIQPADNEIIKLMAQWIGGEMERQQAEAALQKLNYELEQRVQDRTYQLQLALSAAKMGNWEWDMLTNRQYWSAENYALWGFCTDVSGRVLDQTGVEISPFPTFALVLKQTYPDDRDSLLQAVQQTATQHQLYEIEHRILWDDGLIHWRYSRGAYVFNEQGDPIKLVGISMDITDRKRIEQELYRSRDLFAAAFQESADAIFLVDPLSLLILNCNQRAIELFEADCKQDLVGIRGQTLHETPFPDTALNEAQQQVNRQGFWSQEIEYRTLKGRNFWGNLASRQIQVAEQEMHLVRITDISDRKRVESERQQTEAALRQSEARFQQLAANIPGVFYQSLIRADGSRQFHYVSSGFQRLFELNPAQLIADANLFWATVHPDDVEPLQIEVNRTLSTQEPFQLEYRIVPPSGRIKWIHNVASRQYLANGDIVSDGVVLDITDRKQAEAALQTSEQNLRTIFNNVSSQIWVHDADGTIFDINGRVLENLALKREQLLQLSLLDLNPPATHAHLQRYWQQTMAEAGETVRFEWHIPEYGTGKLLDLDITLNRISWGGKAVILAHVQNVSDRKQAERYLQRQAEADQLLAAIAQTINQSVHLNEVLDICLKQIRQFLQCDRVLVCRFDANYDVVIELEAVSQPEFSLLGQTIEDPCFGATWAERYRQGHTTIRHNTQTEAIVPCYADRLAQMQVRASLIVAILQADQIWGLLIVHQCQTPRQWQPSEVDLLKQLGLQIGTASQKASLYTQLENQLAQKEVLLKEVHHRVKNNLQIISAVLWLQSEAANNPVVSGALSDTRNRLQAMSLTHEFLYQSGDLGQINFHDYIQRLANNILIACSTYPDQIKLIFHLQPVIVNLETAISCGLLLNELITNAIKHGFPDRRCGEIRIILEQTAQPEAITGIAANLTTATPSKHSSQAASHYSLTIQDNGVGIPKTLKLNKLQSLGLKIVYDLARQLDGNIEHEHKHGTLFRLTFPVLGHRQEL